VAQGVSSEFKPQYCKKTKNKKTKQDKEKRAFLSFPPGPMQLEGIIYEERALTRY
jgi:hypothetical protein